ncbi:MAG: trigger factor [Oscillospiraceae bacterium]|jgi:trigger factor|nr:trigger factor [Oscillospiraceae bacterium]
MGFISKEKVEAGIWKITADIDAETFCAELDKTFVKELPKLQMPGFRKGKVPRPLAEKRYGDNLFFEETINALIPAQVDAVVKETEIETVADPYDLDIEKISKEDGVSYSFTLIAKPEITVSGYKGIEVPQAEVDISETDVDDEIEQLRQRNARLEEVQRPAQLGDVVQINYMGTLDGVPFDGGTAENHDLKLGSGDFIPGFEDQIVEHSTGEKFDIEVCFPEDYGEQTLAGKSVVFAIELLAVKAEELPEVDDDFAQDQDFDDVADMRTKLLARLKEEAEEGDKELLEHTVQDALAEKVEGEIAAVLFRNRARRNEELLVQRIQIPIENYLRYFGQDADDFHASMLERAEAQVKVELALEEIARQEGIMPSDEEIEAEYQRLATAYETELALVKYRVPKNEIISDLQREKALALVKETAVRVEPKEADDEDKLEEESEVTEEIAE